MRTIQATPAKLQTISRLASKITISATVELGPDNGKPLGTLFQFRRALGPWGVNAAVGVPQFYNHYVRNNTRLLHVHGRKADESLFSVQELGTSRVDKPRSHAFVIDGVLVDGTNRQYYNENSSSWVDLPNPWYGAAMISGEQINYAHRLGNDVLISTDKGVFYAGVRILDKTYTPTYNAGLGTVLYYNGRLFLDYNEGKIDTYSWTPGSPLGPLINTFTTIATHFLRAFAVVGGVVYAVSSYGRLMRYNWDANSWAYVTQTESVNEFYSAMVVQGTLRLGDYPNGDQWVVNSNGDLERLPNYPPEEAGAGPNVREIQSMAMYGGDQILPLFPWGHVHRQHMATGNWSYQRLYTAPPLNTSEGPYVNEFGNGDWRQRLPCAGLYKDGVFVTASNTPGNLLVANHESVSNKAEYGKVWLLKRLHAFSTELDWKTTQTTFRFELSSAGIKLYQDNVEIGSTSGFAPSQLEGSDNITLELGNGLYGPFTGTILNSDIQLEF